MHAETLHPKIHEIRNCKVMLDYDLAALYEVETRILNQSVKRNLKRFPIDFMFQLTTEEMKTISSQIVMTSSKRPKSALPYAFTEQGIAMLRGILNSDIAINANIAIMRTFVMMRKHALLHRDLNEKIKLLEDKYDMQFGDVYEALHFLVGTNGERKPIGYK